MPHPTRHRSYPPGWSLGLIVEIDVDDVAYVGFITPDTAMRKAAQAEQQTGVAMELIALDPHGYGYRPAAQEAVA